MRLDQFTDETRRLHDLARKEVIRMAWIGHAEEEMRADAISKIDILHICKRGFVSSIEISGKRWRWRVVGRDCDGRAITAIVIPDEESGRITVVTAWAG